MTLSCEGTHKPRPVQAHLVDVGQCTLTGELHRVHLHGRAHLNGLILIAQGSHVEHERLRGTDELIVHLGREKAGNKTKTDQLLSSRFDL